MKVHIVSIDDYETDIDGVFSTQEKGIEYAKRRLESSGHYSRIEVKVMSEDDAYVFGYREDFKYPGQRWQIISWDVE